eukprot:GEZU01027272.1.p2 GENE.GEZU01027272.1~~GEZU01027272.1.p2  ORF type:complete len:109 (+),score=4.36 GEZU01027272.1:129-455(+)
MPPRWRPSRQARHGSSHLRPPLHPGLDDQKPHPRVRTHRRQDCSLSLLPTYLPTTRFKVSSAAAAPWSNEQKQETFYARTYKGNDKTSDRQGAELDNESTRSTISSWA